MQSSVRNKTSFCTSISNPKQAEIQIVGLHGEELKIAITAPPVDGKANAHLTKYLAKQFKVAKNAITIEKGELGRHKQVRIISPSIIPAAIEGLLTSDHHNK